MDTPITEHIAENIKDAINAITEANGYNYDLTAVRRRWVEFESLTPEDRQVLIQQSEDEPGVDPVKGSAWKQRFQLLAMVTETGLSESESIELKMGRIRDDIRKKLLIDTTRAGYAIDTINLGAVIQNGVNITAIMMEVEVQYSTVFGDPYTNLYA